MQKVKLMQFKFGFPKCLETSAVAELMLMFSSADQPLLFKFSTTPVADAGFGTEIIFSTRSPYFTRPLRCHRLQVFKTVRLSNAFMMERVMRSSLHQFEIFDTIVPFDFVNMVDNFVETERAA